MGYFDSVKDRRTTTTTIPARSDIVPLRGEIHPYAQAIREAWLNRLSGLARPWVQGAAWDTNCFVTARKLIEVANSPWAGYSLTGAHADYITHAPHDSVWDKREKCWTQALERSGAQALPEPDPLAPIPDITTLAEAGIGTDAATQLALHQHRLAAAEVERQRATRTARRILDSEEAVANFRIPPHRPTLTAELAIPDEPVRYAVDKLLPKGGNVLLAAQFKAGKTTLTNQLARNFADGDPFLGKFAIGARTGRIALFNYEVDERQYRSWLRAIGVHNTDNIVVLNLRGYRLPLTAGAVEDWVVNWLTDHDVTGWVVDPFARAFVGSGTSENDNAEVGVFLDTLDVIKKRAGVEELILPTHTGRAVFEPGEEHARGATRLDDWADVRWLLTKDENDVRYFRATGRDVEIDEERLTFHEATRTLTFGGGDRNWERRQRLENAVVEAVTEEPGMSTNRLRLVVRGMLGKAENTAIDSAAEGARKGHLIRVEQDGQAQRHYPVTGPFTLKEGT